MYGPDTCRLCMNKDALTDIYKMDSETTIDKKIRFCVDLQISTGDGFPGLVCKTCEKNIQAFYDFKKKCLYVDKKLRTMQSIAAKLNLDDPNFDSIEMDVKLECDVFSKMDSNSTKFDTIKMDNKLECGEFNKIDGKVKNSFATWLSGEAGPDFYADCFDQTANKVERKETSSDQVEINSSNNHINVPIQQSLKNRRRPLSSHKIYQCEVCGRIVKNKSVLAKHIATHSGVKQFSCKLCTKTFTRAEHKVIHMRTHLGIKPFICEICGRSFTKRQDLIMHMRIHSDEKKYACSICDRRFKRSNDARSHMRTHTGARPYSCSHCNKSYTSHSGLRKHYNAHCKKENVIIK